MYAKYISKALMTYCLKFQVGNIVHACYFAVVIYLSNFCHGLSYLLGTFSSKMESER